MKYKNGKPGLQAEKSSRVVPMTIMLVVLCGFSFYLGGIFCSEKNSFDKKDAKVVANAVVSPNADLASPLRAKSVAFLECRGDYQDYTPCTDPRVNTISVSIS